MLTVITIPIFGKNKQMRSSQWDGLE